MKCAWENFINLLPINYRTAVDRLGAKELQECRLRQGMRPLLVMKNGVKPLDITVSGEDLSFVVNAASRYSPWSAATMKYGYITAKGGHRIGICGDAALLHEKMTGYRGITSLCMRVSRDFPGLAAEFRSFAGSLLIIGPPGAGKTTLLRDLIRQRSEYGVGSVGVVDERGELFPIVENAYPFACGSNTDILTGCSKKHGMEVLLRTMGPACIAVDEITSEEDCLAMMTAGWSGVSLLATAHAGSVRDLQTRPIYQPIVRSGLFSKIIVLRPDKSWTVEVL